ncbi:MAG: trypsin-like peptidase domain-containing protein [Oscillospiraceae bacterium]|nr:trypsin-like peptidase domain-containing protein [Oscillospiraceae bacterium]
MYYNDYNHFQQESMELQPIAPPEPPKKKKGRGLKLAALCLVCALLGGIGGGLAVRNIPALSGNNTTLFEGSHAPVAVDLSNIHTGQPMTGAQVYAKNVGASVGITTELVTTNYWGQKVKGAAAGSGFVISAEGYILTNYHVIKGATAIQVAFVDGKTYPATLIGGEEANDIAVLKIEATGLTPVVLGDSDNLVVGEQVCAIGNPLGELTFTFTAGCVSARDRSITMENGEVMNMLQTDTAINSGNSGGPLFNMYGEVIGITTAKYSANSSSSTASIEGIGFAIPINDVKDMVKDLMEKGYVTGKPSLGILMNDVSAEATYRYGIPQGAYIEAVLENSCAQKAGLQVGDIVTAVGDHTVGTSTALQSVVKEYKAGAEITLAVYRNGETLTLTVTLDENTLQRTDEMQALQEEYQKTYQQQQQQQNTWSWPFGFGW